MRHAIRTYYQKHIPFTDSILFLLLGMGIILGSIPTLLNDNIFHYPTILIFMTHITLPSYLHFGFFLLLTLFFIFYSPIATKTSPHGGTFLWAISFYFLIYLVNLFIVNGLQATPFTPIDTRLVQFDRLLGIEMPALMQWTYQHHWLHHTLNIAYNSLGFQLLLIPAFLVLCNAQTALRRYFISLLFATLVGCLVYYFFPTMAPSGIFKSPYFTTTQHHTSLRFFEIHHFLRLTASDGGLIAFPSFHVMWAILLTDACRNQKIVYYPLIFWNLLLMTSTVLLGWHYFADVIGGILLGMSGIYFAKWCLNAST